MPDTVYLAAWIKEILTVSKRMKAKYNVGGISAQRATRAETYTAKYFIFIITYIYTLKYVCICIYANMNCKNIN